MRNRERVLHEITPVMESNILYIVDRKHKVFDFPIHTHEVFELNFIERASGAMRIVGDSREVIGDMDLVLIANGDLEHIWEQHEYYGRDAREVTIQFDLNFEKDSFFSATSFDSIREMFLKARRGVAFPKEAILKVYHLIDTIGGIKEGFYAVQTLLTILYELSKFGNMRQLASTEHLKDAILLNNDKIEEIKDYISANYRSEITLPDMARRSCMSISSFGRFFKLHTGRTLSEYLIYMRLGFATNQLIETDRPVTEICFASGFNNMSHFNRLFKRNKGCSPTQFRDTYRRRLEFDAGENANKF